MESERTVLVTGASTGIGLAMARALAQTKYKVFLTARQSSLARFDVHAIGAETLSQPGPFIPTPLENALLFAGEVRI